MSKVLAPRNGKICVLCANWNGSVGSTTIEAKPGGNLFTTVLKFKPASKKV